MSSHENLSRQDPGRASSHRAFGIVFAVVFLVVALWPLIGGGRPRAWALAVAAAFGVVSLAAPVLLAPLNRLWQKLGNALHHVVSPVVLVFMFYVVVTPMALLMRRFSKSIRHWRPGSERDSHWVLRDPPGPKPDSMNHQF